MATTIIEKGQIRRRSRVMTTAQADACARMMATDPKHSAGSISVVACGIGKARVEWTPANATTLFKHFREKQGLREEKMAAVRRYKWRRIGNRAWHCQGPESHQHYTIFLDKVAGKPAHCTCPDWPTISSVGGKCKHFMVAEEAEANYQRDRGEAAKFVVRDAGADGSDPYETLPQGRAQ